MKGVYGVLLDGSEAQRANEDMLNSERQKKRRERERESNNVIKLDFLQVVIQLRVLQTGRV